ncbi:MAG: O-methyltransferase [Actinomycetota bacterium]|jgi:caffeoyl-CoA O-methyltransferase|nr:O-methyltransferase [Actinomycetota bacterium]
MSEIFVAHPDVEAYAEAHSAPEPPWLVEAAEDTRATLSFPGMMVGPLEGRFLQMLVYALDPREVLEIGTFSGYSALSMAEALSPGGRITTCDISRAHVEAAARHIEASPFADRIVIREGPALQSIEALDGPFDLVFIDADKENYLAYYEAVLPKLSPRGLIVVDNTLWSARVLDQEDVSDATRAIRAFNDAVVSDGRVVCVQLTVRDGVTLIRRAGTPEGRAGTKESRAARPEAVGEPSGGR